MNESNNISISINSPKGCLIAFLIFVAVIIIYILVSILPIIPQIISANKKIKTLEKEYNEILKLDLFKDDFNRPLVFSGEDANYEKALKEYIDKNAKTIQKINKDIDSIDSSKLLDYKKYKENINSFDDSFIVIENIKEKIQKEIKELDELGTKQKIGTYITKYTTDPYYTDSFYEMIEEYRKDRLNEAVKITNKSADETIKYLDNTKNILVLLRDNYDDWALNDDTIVFTKKELVASYRELMKEVE